MQNETITVSVTEPQLHHALDLISVGLQKYRWIQENFCSREPSTDTEFQRRYNGFYRVRRGDTWRAEYFYLLQDVRDNGASFRDVLTRLKQKTGRVEASFSSKLFATVYPKFPVIDSIVLKTLNLRLPASLDEDRVAKICELYASLADAYAEYLSSRDGRTLVEKFQRRYPQSGITETKMLDLVLWQSRED